MKSGDRPDFSVQRRPYAGWLRQSRRAGMPGRVLPGELPRLLACFRIGCCLGLWLAAWAVSSASGAQTAETEAGAEVAVVYNALFPGSKEVAEHYAKRRQVPREQVIGMDLPTGEAMTRKDFLKSLQEQLLIALEARGLFKMSAPTNEAMNGRLGSTRFRVLLDSRIRYVLLCYGVRPGS